MTAKASQGNRYPGRRSRRRLSVAVTRLLVFVAVLLSLRYFWWRFLHTGNPLALWFFYLFLVVELWNFFEVALFYLTTWKPTHRQPLPPLPDRTVDVFIATYNEPVSLLRETALCAVSIRYPHETYILDDGNRPAVSELAKELGCGYIARAERTHAKAGNLNHGLTLTSGEFIVTLDADHVPMPDLIDQLIGFFVDPTVAIVQTAQDFYNLDSFQHVTEWDKQYSWQQQELFFSIIQPGKDGYNAAFYCGSPAMLRRKPLEGIGGFATESITEDMHTGLRLQKRGWRVLYYNRTLARGLAPQTFVGFATQWRRWGEGTMQVLRQENPIFGQGLTLGQRLCYFASFYYYLMSFQKVLYVLIPIFCLFSGLYPFVADPSVFALYFAPYFAANVLVSALLQGGLRSSFLNERFNVLKTHVLMSTIGGLVRRQTHFAVTPKTQSPGAQWRDIWPLSVMLVGLILALVVGTWRLFHAGHGYPFWAVVVNLFWAVFYLIVLAPVVWRAKTRRELRASYRFPSQLDVPVQFNFKAVDGSTIRAQGFARNLNRHGCSVTHDRAIPVGTLLSVELVLPSRTVQAQGRILRNQEYAYREGIRVANGFRFEQIEPSDQDEISKHLFWEVAPRHGSQLRLTQSTQDVEPTHESVEMPAVPLPVARGTGLSRAPK